MRLEVQNLCHSVIYLEYPELTVKYPGTFIRRFFNAAVFFFTFPQFLLFFIQLIVVLSQLLTVAAICSYAAWSSPLIIRIFSSERFVSMISLPDS
jgi:hypothetical protein